MAKAKVKTVDPEQEFRLARLATEPENEITKNLIDELGELKEQLKPLLKREKILKKQLSTLGAGVHKGFHWYIHSSICTWTGVNVKLLQTEQFAIYNQYYIETPYLQIEPKPRI